MKILILQDDFFPEVRGGAAIVAFGLSKGFLSRGHEVSVITATQNINLVGKSKVDGIDIYRLFSSYHERWRAYVGLYNRQTVGQIRKIIADIKPDIVHAHNIHQHLSYHSLKLAKKNGAKVFLTAHDSMLYAYEKVDNESKISWFMQLKDFRFRYNPFRNLIIRHYLRHVKKIIAVSNSLKRSLINNDIDNVVVVHNGVDPSDWVVSEQFLRDINHRFGLGNKKVILLVGRLGISKGSANIIKALAIIKTKTPEVLLLVAGGGSYTETMKKLAQNLGIGDQVVFTDWLNHDEMAATYHITDVVVFPSIYPDPFGMVNIEAMACSRPVVATCFGGASEIVVNGETGYIVDSNDPTSLADKISELLINKDKAYQFGQAGRRRVQELFTLQVQINSYMKLFMIA